ncbi:aspartyl/asparaginyl beta-hydroxylase domain-containing protein [Neolewinella lacunae]|uniref:Aspartyl/asparaginyl beta-hydroxylase domain-containing protein n=1 Tax=Neolewinella lacunae TaxID=1517758 RepID=A0A923T7Y9_9BACT|nr:aspartyl/asparaginyl beta-hydroxylase domain-containing protein [Neolewinella lacunae]MBC6994016.1 aspartyl/asparaginyl beta-hydroxylase domain-containing protein [Neolewinella lacunae]MDN3634686.1 aspartyl/asparaginyl beta-hydroxylase domain-containing protein [Neolewinella lacunae]
MDSHKLSLHFDARRLEEDLEKVLAASADWIDHYVTQNYEGSWSVIPLRANRNATHPVMMIYSDPTSDDYVDTPFLAACPYFAEVLGHFHTRLLAARLMRLGRGSIIKEHRDHDLDVEGGTVRIHVPVVTNPEVHFLLNGRRVIMQAGECWYLRLSDPHSVRNDGPDRVHLVMDMEVNDWVLAQLGAALAH